MTVKGGGVIIIKPSGSESERNGKDLENCIECEKDERKKARRFQSFVKSEQPEKVIAK